VYNHTDPLIFMEIFTMKCPKCGRVAPPTIGLDEGEKITIKDDIAPSTVCICGTVSKIPPGEYKGTSEGLIKE